MQLEEPDLGHTFVLAVEGAWGPAQLGKIPPGAVGTHAKEEPAVEFLGFMR
jgi:hypothetical protein